jgi:predicted phosphodiesterase
VADIVAKVFLGRRTKILRAADAFCAHRREGPYRLIQNRSRASAVALKGDAAAEKSKEQLREIFRVVRFSTFATWGNSGIEPDKGKGISSPGT